MRSPSGFIRPGFDPLKNPDAPTIGTATEGDAELSVTFTAPAVVGGSAITSYLATARKTSDGTLTGVSGASSPIVVTSLTNGDAYTATVLAINSYGPSAASAASNSVTPAVQIPTVGAAYEGGFFAGQISTAGNGVADYNLVVGPLATAENSSKQWDNKNTATPGADSLIDGPQNTADMVADGNATVYPGAHFCNGVTSGGFSDWYMPARNELEVCYYNLKPNTTSNSAAWGGNTNAVPSRGSNYTAGTPAQTSATIFQGTNSEAFSATLAYWSSTEASATQGFRQIFSYGGQYAETKSLSRRVRAVRRVAV
tara:strand:+ start:1205 stop:2140 length:936 start_codon:yes stop_codon:yes gene_type:complete